MSQDALGEPSDVNTGRWFGISAKEAFREIAYGSVAGMVAEIFEYPFDLAKVRLQAQLLPSVQGGPGVVFRGPLDCLNQTWKEEGLRGLYRGVSVPVVGSMAQTAGLFFAYSSFQSIIQSYGTTHLGETKKPPLTIPQLGVAAAGAGFTTSFILTPIELIKCRIQVQMMNKHSQLVPHHPKSLSTSLPTAEPFSYPARLGTPMPTLLPSTFKSPTRGLATIRSHSPLHTFTLEHGQSSSSPGAFSIIRSVLRDRGLKGFWLGQTGTIFRETGGCAVWFVVKELVAKALQERRLKLHPERTAGDGGRFQPDSNSDLLMWESAVAGAAAGAAGVLLIYPADTVKSVIQTEEQLRSPSSKVRKTAPSTFWRTILKMYRAHGIRGLYSGCGMTVAKSVPSSGIIFVVYDGLRQWYG